eukprot:EG_transcript_18182
MLEAAGLIYALNTLFKIALFTQFLEYGLSPFSRDMLAGAGGALVSILLLYSVDTLKTRQQLPVPLARKQGLYRGWFYGVLRECSAGALYVAVFYAARNALLAHGWLPVSGVGVSLAAVVVATLLASIFRVPFEVMNKRVQAGMSSRTAASLTFKGKGKRLFLTPSWLAVELREIPYNLLQLLLFRYLQIPLLRCTFLPDLALRLTCGLLAGAGAAVATAPLDVAATRAILTDDGGPSEAPVSGALAQLWTTLSSSFAAEGRWLGNRLRVVYSAASTCIFFSVVEALRAAL